MNEIEMVTFSTDEEKKRRSDFVGLLKGCPIPEGELLDNLGLFLNSKTFSRIKFMDFLYQKIVEIPGVIMEFGTRWGQNAALFSSLRGIYEPYNRTRKIVAFDTFEGFPEVSPQDGTCKSITPGGYKVTAGYDAYLDQVLAFHEKENPLGHIKKYALVKGDATSTLPRYLEEYPETIISLAYFDFDLYEPTKKCLQLIRERLVKGSIVGFDELNEHETPGETLAVMEVLGLRNLELRRLSYVSRVSYFEVK
ncbi:MAG TPA: TylF/MycF/NovP-related O-methyltransferase [Syntrophorhabdaceae bacterium]|jgi:hypothetical protein